MTTAQAIGTRVRGAHLVGSVPLHSAEDVFRTLVARLGTHLRRLPDGETGDRSIYVGYQRNVFWQHPLLEPGPPVEGALPSAVIRPKAGVDAKDIEFGPLGYAAAAATSYAVFTRLRSEGVIPKRMRFQVCLPLPIDALVSLVAPHAQVAIGLNYGAAMVRELQQVLTTIAHADLAIQLDVCGFIWLWEGFLPADPAMGSDPKPALLDGALRMAEPVPDDVELGFHLCYGDWNHQHLREPTDTAVLTTVANALSSRVHRPVQWIHMPVPIERSDDAYFEPLTELRPQPETELYLGLVHARDGADGARKRIAAAERTTPWNFGVATECGMGRRPPERGGSAETLQQLLDTHAAVAAPVHK